MPGIGDAKCVLVVGATAGIGKALALAIHDLPSKPIVIVAGRRQERIDALCRQSNRLHGLQIDLTSGKETLKAFATSTVSKYPQVGVKRIHLALWAIYSSNLELDAVVYSSGIQHIFDFSHPEKVDLDREQLSFSTLLSI